MLRLPASAARAAARSPPPCDRCRAPGAHRAAAATTRRRTDAPTPEEVLAAAKKTLDETSGVRISLATEDLPDGVTGVEQGRRASAPTPRPSTARSPSSLSGQAFEVPVVAVDDKVYVQLPLTTGCQDIDPGSTAPPTRPS